MAATELRRREYPLTPEQRVIMRKLRGLQRRHQRVLERVDMIEEERTELYAQGRALDPPLTFRQLADVFGVTTQSVIQKLDRREARRDSQATG